MIESANDELDQPIALVDLARRSMPTASSIESMAAVMAGGLENSDEFTVFTDLVKACWRYELVYRNMLVTVAGLRGLDCSDSHHATGEIKSANLSGIGAIALWIHRLQLEGSKVLARCGDDLESVWTEQYRWGCSDTREYFSHPARVIVEHAQYLLVVLLCRIGASELLSTGAVESSTQLMASNLVRGLPTLLEQGVASDQSNRRVPEYERLREDLKKQQLRLSELKKRGAGVARTESLVPIAVDAKGSASRGTDEHVWMPACWFSKKTTISAEALKKQRQRGKLTKGDDFRKVTSRTFEYRVESVKRKNPRFKLLPPGPNPTTPGQTIGTKL